MDGSGTACSQVMRIRHKFLFLRLAKHIRIFLLSPQNHQFSDKDVRKRPLAPGRRVKADCVSKYQKLKQLDN